MRWVLKVSVKIELRQDATDCTNCAPRRHAGKSLMKFFYSLADKGKPLRKLISSSSTQMRVPAVTSIGEVKGVGSGRFYASCFTNVAEVV